jgi:hypothetical protein
MATLNQLAYNYALLREKENDPQFIELARFNYIHYRSVFIRRDQEKNKILPVKSVQPIVCDMVTVPTTEIAGSTVGTMISRTKDPIPSVIRLKARDAFEFIGPIDGIEPFSIISPREAQYVSLAQFTKKIPRVYFRRGYLYVVNKKPSQILIEAAFEDPTKLEKYLRPDGTLAWTDDMEFPLPDDMIEGITKGLVSEELRFLTDFKPNEIKINGNDNAPSGSAG